MDGYIRIYIVESHVVMNSVPEYTMSANFQLKQKQDRDFLRGSQRLCMTLNALMISTETAGCELTITKMDCFKLQ